MKADMVVGKNPDMVVGKNPHGGFSSFAHVKKPKFDCRSSSHTRLHLPENIFFEILLRLPAKSVARFRCVSPAWLSITTDPSFILSHARRTRKSLIVRSILHYSRINKPNNGHHNHLFSFKASRFSIRIRWLHQTSDFACSSCDGLVLFLRKKARHLPYGVKYYVMNPLTGLRIDVPLLNTSEKVTERMELYYHRWTGEYRLLDFSKCIEPIEFHLDASVLSLGGTSSSWRQIKAKPPVDDLSYYDSRIQMNDHLYWACHDFFKIEPSILVFDFLKETFSLIELPSYSQKSAFPSFARGSFVKYGLVDMEGILCLWVIYRDKSCTKNIMIDIWEAVDGDEKWKNTYSLCLADEWRWALIYPSEGHTLADCCLCIKERELLFFFNGQRSPYVKGIRLRHAHYLFHWNLKSGEYRTKRLHERQYTAIPPAIIYRKTIVNPPPLSHTTLSITGSPT